MKIKEEDGKTIEKIRYELKKLKTNICDIRDIMFEYITKNESNSFLNSTKTQMANSDIATNAGAIDDLGELSSEQYSAVDELAEIVSEQNQAISDLAELVSELIVNKEEENNG